MGGTAGPFTQRHNLRARTQPRLIERSAQPTPLQGARGSAARFSATFSMPWYWHSLYGQTADQDPPVLEFESRGSYLLCVDFRKIHTCKIRSGPVWIKLDLKIDSVDSWNFGILAPIKNMYKSTYARNYEHTLERNGQDWDGAVFVYVCVCIYTYSTYIYIYICTYVHSPILNYVLYTCIITCIYLHIYIYIYIWSDTAKQMYMYIYIYIFI